MGYSKLIRIQLRAIEHQYELIRIQLGTIEHQYELIRIRSYRTPIIL